MEIYGKVWKSAEDKFWLAEIPLLDLMVQAKTKKEIPAMIKDAVELLIDNKQFEAEVDMSGNDIYLHANDIKQLIALMLKRLRLKNKLRLEDIANHLEAKSINEYAQYEQAKHLPSIEKLDELIKAIDPHINTVISLR